MVDGSSSPTNRHQLYILPRRGSNGGGVFLVNWREMLEANQECGEDSLSVLECSFVFRWDFLVQLLCTVCKLCTLYNLPHGIGQKPIPW